MRSRRFTNLAESASLPTLAATLVVEDSLARFQAASELSDTSQVVVQFRAIYKDIL